MAEGQEGDAVKKDWVVPIGRNLDLKNEKPWAIRTLYDLLGWKTIRNEDGTFDVDQEAIGSSGDRQGEGK